MANTPRLSKWKKINLNSSIGKTSVLKIVEATKQLQIPDNEKMVKFLHSMLQQSVEQALSDVQVGFKRGSLHW